MTRWLVTLALCLTACAHAREPQARAAVDSNMELLQSAATAQQLGDPLRAQQYLNAALQRGADPARVLPWLLRLYIADGQYRVAIERAADALRVRTQDIPLRMLLATLYRATELDASAAEQYELVLAQAPDVARAHLELALLLQDSGRDVARADQHFRAFLTLAPNAPEAADVRTRLLKELP